MAALMAVLEAYAASDGRGSSEQPGPGSALPAAAAAAEQGTRRVMEPTVRRRGEHTARHRYVFNRRGLHHSTAAPVPPMDPLEVETGRLFGAAGRQAGAAFEQQDPARQNGVAQSGHPEDELHRAPELQGRFREGSGKDELHRAPEPVCACIAPWSFDPATATPWANVEADAAQRPRPVPTVPPQPPPPPPPQPPPPPTPSPLSQPQQRRRQEGCLGSAEARRGARRPTGWRAGPADRNADRKPAEARRAAASGRARPTRAHAPRGASAQPPPIGHDQRWPPPYNPPHAAPQRARGVASARRQSAPAHKCKDEPPRVARHERVPAPTDKNEAAAIRPTHTPAKSAASSNPPRVCFTCRCGVRAEIFLPLGGVSSE